MEVLKNKQQRNDYDALSRYAPFPYFYNSLDKKYIYGLTSHLGTDIEYVAHKVKYDDTLDSLALKYYGRPDYFWVIADFNRIQDPFIPLIETREVINIPSLARIYFEER